MLERRSDLRNGADLRDAETVLAQLVGWFDDYNTQARTPPSVSGRRRSTGSSR